MRSSSTLTKVLFFLSSCSLCEKSEKTATIKDNREEEMSIPHIAGQLNNDLYALPVKRRQQQQQQKSLDDIDTISPDKERSDESDLPPGWEKHEGTFIFRLAVLLLFLSLVPRHSFYLPYYTFFLSVDETSAARFSQIILRTFSNFSFSRSVLGRKRSTRNALNSLKIDYLDTFVFALVYSPLQR